MAELDLANALAQQATRGGGRRGMPRGPGEPTAPRKNAWSVPQLGRDFRLGDATAAAVQKVATTMNKNLRFEGLVVNTSQGTGDLPIAVAEKGGGRVLKAYDTAEFLTVFARQRQESGVIVDGQV